MKYIFSCLPALLLVNFTIAQSEIDSIPTRQLNEFVLKAVKVYDNSPVAHEDILKEDLDKINHGVDIPILLDQATSVVTTSDAGAGVGYTGIRVRGSDATRVNVTINGIPLNDSESQGTFWVDLPDLSSSTNDIQIQRGVGTSSNGAGAFGASINLSTFNTSNSSAPYGEIANSFGSFNTQKNTLKLGTGLIDGKWNFEGRLSRVVSDGFVDRASADLSSYYLSGSYYGNKSTLRAIAFSGHETTYQAWYGAPIRVLDTNQTYNPYQYDNEVDDYTQSHYQLHFSHFFDTKFKVNAALHYTRGFGYYEQYKRIGQNALINYYSQENLADYGLDTIFTSSGDTIAQTDLIRRRWLDNHFYGLVYSAEYNSEKLQLIIGGGANQYLGKHFGEVIWAQYASNGSIRHPYYDNDAIKNDVNVYAKMNYKLKPNLDLYLDLQERFISYEFLGFDNDLNNITQNAQLAFFNPKAGINYQFNNNNKIYAFAGIGNKEPNRDDYTNSTPNSRPEHERMLDVELGYALSIDRLKMNVNFYNMHYKNQLIVTGELNDVGAAIRQNVEDSYRRGMEISGDLRILKNLNWKFNATFSDNKIASFHEYIDDWDTWGKVDSIYTNTDIAFSPSLIASSQLVYSPFNSDKKGALELAFITKYVGEQFIDNTSSIYAKLDDYVVNDFRMSYSIKNKLFKEIVLSSWIRNLFNKNYISNAWIYRFKSDGYNPVPDDIYTNSEGEGTGRYNQIGAFNQAGINFFVGLTVKF
ncbi:MAG: TonB-dependent receptor [Crocinitomicaceae bacterium]|nr:TonB-dependent receptor [Crocinitomicaceae bacterium]